MSAMLHADHVRGEPDQDLRATWFSHALPDRGILLNYTRWTEWTQRARSPTRGSGQPSEEETPEPTGTTVSDGASPHQNTVLYAFHDPGPSPRIPLPLFSVHTLQCSPVMTCVHDLHRHLLYYDMFIWPQDPEQLYLDGIKMNTYHIYINIQII